jgi:acyl-CoA thioesterase I
MPRRPVSPALAMALALAVVGAADTVNEETAAPMAAAAVGCAAPPVLTALGPALARVAARVKQGEPLTIVALGSSSTRGVGASAPELSYPSRLETELRARLPDIAVRVVNRGRSGEEVPQMLARLDRDVLAAHPDLVIWQFGTNAVLHHDDLTAQREPIARAIARLEASGSDVVLMDLQYAPRVVARLAAYAHMERLIADAAQRAHAGLFRRFAIMRQWAPARPGDPSRMIGRDGLHMNDWGYACLARDLADALAANWRPRLPPAPGRAAGMLAVLNRLPALLAAPPAANP